MRFVARVHEADVDDATIPVEGDLLAKAKPGDIVELADTRDRKRVLHVVEVRAGECLCETDTTAYVVPGTRLSLRRKGRIVAKGAVGALPAVEQWIALRPGDILDVVRGEMPGRDAVHDDDGRVLEPAFVSCALPEVFVGRPRRRADALRRRQDPRHRSARSPRIALRVEITAVAGGAAKLQGGEGHQPAGDRARPAGADREGRRGPRVRREARRHGRAVVRAAPRGHRGAARRDRRGSARRELGIVLKIETQAAFNRLPTLLLASMRHPPVAVMVARGDLGVEVGFERLSEVQEEILWLCEAAHVPVIWATQVLESLAKGGLPSRAEVTDAAMGSRAECVMLNKGPYIRETLRFLIDVLGRMEEHQHKKTSRLRKLRVSDPSRPRARTGASNA